MLEGSGCLQNRHCAARMLYHYCKRHNVRKHFCLVIVIVICDLCKLLTANNGQFRNWKIDPNYEVTEVRVVSFVRRNLSKSP